MGLVGEGIEIGNQCSEADDRVEICGRLLVEDDSICLPSLTASSRLTHRFLSGVEWGIGGVMGDVRGNSALGGKR